jgi:hypothetical protein
MVSKLEREVKTLRTGLEETRARHTAEIGRYAAAVQGFKGEMKKMRSFMGEVNEFASSMASTVDEGMGHLEVLKVSVVQVLEWTLQQHIDIDRVFVQGDEEAASEAASTVEAATALSRQQSPSTAALSPPQAAPLQVDDSSEAEESVQPEVEVKIIPATPGNSQGALVDGETNKLDEGDGEIADIDADVDEQGEGEIADEKPDDSDGDGEKADSDVDGGKADSDVGVKADSDVGIKADSNKPDEGNVEEGVQTPVEVTEATPGLLPPPIITEHRRKTPGRARTLKSPAPDETLRRSPRHNVPGPSNLPNNEMPVVPVKRKLVEEEAAKKRAKK